MLRDNTAIRIRGTGFEPFIVSGRNVGPQAFVNVMMAAIARSTRLWLPFYEEDSSKETTDPDIYMFRTGELTTNLILEAHFAGYKVALQDGKDGFAMHSADLVYEVTGQDMSVDITFHRRQGKTRVLEWDGPLDAMADWLSYRGRPKLKIVQ